MSLKGQSERIAIVYPTDNLVIVHCVRNVATLLARHGYLVDIFTYPSQETSALPTFTDPRISAWTAYIPARRDRPWYGRILPGRIYQPLNLRLRHSQAPYRCVIGVDPRGLLVADQMFRGIATPLAYYSLEMLLSYEVKTQAEKDLKKQELELSQRAAFVIALGEERAQLLARDNGLAAERTISLPNAPLGQGWDRRTKYLHKKFNLPSSTKIVLHAGATAAWACSHQLAHSTREWPDDWVLVLHRHVPWVYGHDYEEAIRYLAAPGRILFSIGPLPDDEYQALVASADIGVAFYAPQKGQTVADDNMRYIGLASGKLAYYLWAGIPTITTDLPALRRLVEQYVCGALVADPASTRAAIQQIIDAPDEYRQNAIACFDKEMCFERAFATVLKVISEL